MKFAKINLHTSIALINLLIVVLFAYLTTKIIIKIDEIPLSLLLFIVIIDFVIIIIL